MAPLTCKKYEGYRLVQMPSTKQSYPLREELVTILEPEWPLLRKEYSDATMVGSYFVMKSLNHQLERVVGVIQDALIAAR